MPEMHVLARETIDHVDSMAHAYVHDHWSPESRESNVQRDRLSILSTDLNLLDMPETDERRSSLEGRDQALLVVRTDLAMKASEIMNAIPKHELEFMDHVDPSIAHDPVGFDLSPEEKASAAFQKADWVERSKLSGGSPAPSLIDRGPIEDATAGRIFQIAGDVMKQDKGWKRKRDPHVHQDTVILLDRAERIDRNRKDVVDPETRKAYDLVYNDMALKVADNVSRALIAGAIKPKAMDEADARIMKDPHVPTRFGGLAQQAAMLKEFQSVSGKGPRTEQAPTQARAGAER